MECTWPAQEEYLGRTVVLYEGCEDYTDRSSCCGAGEGWSQPWGDDTLWGKPCGWENNKCIYSADQGNQLCGIDPNSVPTPRPTEVPPEPAYTVNIYMERE